ncbi:hypothetical protein TESG_08415 [Trichophyton tonsurans CBS 112818]|uniref:Uncharacterized protein n=1 Tax=Trichophyton tonsurans (strain CBS 112818) TaxID=647933 RepID=F2RXA0_TRIT1|nr:hypothetical protein TESG_08415 [Trichophyton tonsurans CBS 112818]
MANVPGEETVDGTIQLAIGAWVTWTSIGRERAMGIGATARPAGKMLGRNRSESTAATICHHANQSIVTGQSRPDLRETNTPAFPSRGIIRLGFRRTNNHRFLSVALGCVVRAWYEQSSLTLVSNLDGKLERGWIGLHGDDAQLLSLAARSDAGVALHALFKAAASMGAEVTPSPSSTSNWYSG